MRWKEECHAKLLRCGDMQPPHGGRRRQEVWGKETQGINDEGGVVP